MDGDRKKYLWDGYIVEMGDFKEKVYRVRPVDNLDGVKRWFKEMKSMPELKEYDIVLSGSFPYKTAPDVDVFFKPDESMNLEDLDHKDLEKVFKRGLDIGLKEEGIFFDTHVSTTVVTPIELDMLNYILTGNPTRFKQISYGATFIADDKVLRDYTDHEHYSDLLYTRHAVVPSKKQLKLYKKNRKEYNAKYINKPIMIKSRQKIYGN